MWLHVFIFLVIERNLIDCWDSKACPYMSFKNFYSKTCKIYKKKFKFYTKKCNFTEKSTNFTEYSVKFINLQKEVGKMKN